MIWDLHCHLSGVEGKTPDERIAKLIEHAEKMRVEKTVFFMGFPWSLDPDPEEFRRQNDQVMQALSHWHDRAMGLAYVNPKYPEESVAEIERCIAEGPLVGIKLWVAKRCGEEAIDPIIKRTAELKGLIFQHTWLKGTGNLEGESTPQDLVLLAKRFPEIPFVCGHTGGDWELGIRAVRGQKNVSVEIGGSDPTSGFVEMAVRELGAERVLFGSDMGGRSLASQLAKVRGAGLSTAEEQLIFKGNLKKLLLPIMKEKGFLS